MDRFTDQTGRMLTFSKTPQRIISLVPSQTELVYSLGLDNEVCGITKFCVHPQQWFNNKPRIGGTKNVDFEKIKSLQPDLIIANKEENSRQQVEELALHYPVWVTDVSNYNDALKMIADVGTICGCADKATLLVQEIERKFEEVEIDLYQKVTAAYLIWKDPYMTVGGDTFINDMLHKACLQNVFSTHTRYPEISLEQLAKARPEVLLLSSEPYPFSQKHIEELKPLFPHTKIAIADGELFSWYGSRMVKAPSYFKQLREHINSL